MCNNLLIDLINWFLIGMGVATLTAMIIMPIVLYRQHKEYKEFSARINDKISMNGRATNHRIKLWYNKLNLLEFNYDNDYFNRKRIGNYK